MFNPGLTLFPQEPTFNLYFFFSFFFPSCRISPLYSFFFFFSFSINTLGVDICSIRYCWVDDGGCNYYLCFFPFAFAFVTTFCLSKFEMFIVAFIGGCDVINPPNLFLCSKSLDLDMNPTFFFSFSCSILGKRVTKETKYKRCTNNHHAQTENIMLEDKTN
jgi:hypothetical protein